MELLLLKVLIGFTVGTLIGFDGTGRRRLAAAHA